MSKSRRIHMSPRTAHLGTSAAVAVLAAGIVVVSPAIAHQRPGSVERVTIAYDGAQSNNHSYYPQLSGDGRYFAFSSLATNLLPDRNGWQHVYLVDRNQQTIERVSVAPDGSPGYGRSQDPTISKDGRYIAFSSSANNLVPDDTNDTTDIFVYDRETREMKRVSIATDGTQANDSSQDPYISGDGRFVTFTSRATSLVPENGNGERHVMVHDLTTGITETVSLTPDGRSPGGPSFFSTLSHDGRFVTYDSFANDIVEDDFNVRQDVFVHDRETGQTELISVNHAGGPADESSFLPTLSGDGRYVAFASYASNVVPGTVASGWNPYIYVRDRQEDRTERVSVTSGGGEPTGFSTSPRISPDGRYVLYHSFADDLVPNDTNKQQDAFLYDRLLKLTEIVTLTHDGSEADGRTFNASMTSDARHVALYSLAKNIVPDDTNGVGDGFIRDRGPAIGVFQLQAVPSSAELIVSGAAVLQGAVIASGDGRATPGAWELGAEIRRARLAYRPELDDLHLTIELTAMHRQFGIPGIPGITYGFDLSVAGVGYQARAVRGLSSAPGPSFVLYRCAGGPVCERVADLEGGYGSTGTEITMSIPTELVGADEAVVLSGLHAWTGPAEAGAPPATLLSEADLGSASIPGVDVAIAVVPPGEPVNWDEGVPLDPVEGRFEQALDASTLASGPYDVWGRACVGVVCGHEMTTVWLGNAQPDAVADSATTLAGVPVRINVLGNDSDPDGDSLTVTGVSDPPNGTAINNGDGTVTYRSNCGFQGIDTFTYTISDGKGGTDTGLVTVRVRKTSRRGSLGC